MTLKFSLFKPLASRAGFSLVEVIVATGIFSVAVLGLAVGAITITKANKTSQFSTVATNMAQDMLEQLKALPIANVAPGNDTVAYQGANFARAWTVTPNPPVALANNQISVTVTWTDYIAHNLTVTASAF